MLPVDNLLVKAEDLLRQKKYEELIVVCEQIIEKEEDNEFTIHSIGKAYYYLKNYDESIKYLEKVSGKYIREYRYLSPAECDIVLDYGKCLLKLDRLDEALSVYDAYLTSNNIQAEALREDYFRTLSKKCFYHRRIDDAIKCLDYYLDYKPDSYKINETKLDILLSEMEYDNVLEFYDENTVKDRLKFLKEHRFFIKTYDINIIDTSVSNEHLLDLANHFHLESDVNNIICRWYLFGYAYALNNNLDKRMAESYANIITMIFTNYRIDNGIDKYYDQNKIIEEIRIRYNKYNEVEDEKEKAKPLLDDVLNIYTDSFEGYSRKTETIELSLSYSLLEKFKNVPGEDDFNKFRNLLFDYHQYQDIKYNSSMSDCCKHLNYDFRDKMIWKKLYSKDKKLIYEGFTLNNKPCGLGTEYDKDGNKIKEGIFDIKGLCQGKEYYSNGQVRFEGTYHIHRGYGPNYPLNGNYYSEEGELLYSGKFRIFKGNIGFPRVMIPRNYGRLGYDDDNVKYLMWEDVRNI